MISLFLKNIFLSLPIMGDLVFSLKESLVGGGVVAWDGRRARGPRNGRVLPSPSFFSDCRFPARVSPKWEFKYQFY